MATRAIQPSWKTANRIIADRIVSDFASEYTGKNSTDWLAREIAAAMDACCKQRSAACLSLPIPRQGLV